jgi:HEAT repeat protein
MNHPFRPGPGWGRARLVGLLVIAGLFVLAGQRPVRAQKARDPAVEQFRQALILERNDKHTFKMSDEAIKKAIAFRRRNLEAKAKQLRRPNQLAAALLLPEWPLESILPLPGTYEAEAGTVEKEVRDELIDRLTQEVRKIFARGSPPLQVATATLLGEMVSALAGDLGEQERERVRAREASKLLGRDTLAKPKDQARGLLYEKLLDLANDLKKLAGSSSPEVRTATARALSQFSKRADVAGSALRSLLVVDSSNPVTTRREAANALLNLIQAVSGTELERSSEPGVSTRETKRTRPLFGDADQIAVIAAVAPVAAQGVNDPDPLVRRTCTAALTESAAALHQVVRGLGELFQRPGGASFTAEYSFPPPEREWAPDEQRSVDRSRQFIWDKEKNLLKPALLAFTQKPTQRGDVSVQQALTRAAFDTDPGTRLNTRRALDRLALVRSALHDLQNAVPLRSNPTLPPPEDRQKKQEKPKDKDKLDVRARPARKIILTAGKDDPPVQREPLRLPATIAVRQKEKEDDKKDDKKELDEPLPTAPDKEVEKGRAALDQMLRGIGREMVRRQYIDPNPQSRRSSFLAVEGIGEAAIPLIPQIVQGTKDKDLFVRWTAARTLGKLGQAPSKLSAAQVDTSLRALTHLLDDDDLDVQIAAAKAIEAFGPGGAAATAGLTAHVNKGDAEFRIAVIRAIEGVGMAARSALPAISRELGQLDPRLRAEAARAIGRFGSYGRPYLAELTKLNNDPDSEVRRAASSAIINILDE